MAPSTTSAALATTAAVMGFSTIEAFVTPGGNAISSREGKQHNFAASVHESQGATASSDEPVVLHGGGLGLAAFGAVATAVAWRWRAAAAVPQAQRSKKQLVSLSAFENELGVQAPVGFWDPLGLSSDGDAAVFKRRRETEIKHGRVSMLATMGYITPEITGKLPGYLSPSMGLKFADVPNGLAAISQVPAAGWAQIVAYCFYCEYSNGYGENSPVPGESGFKPPLLATDDAELKTKRLNAELANGRLAMAAIIGMFFQDGLTGSAWGDWAQYTDSPLRAFENELGVQAPVGFWDPLGLSSDGDAAVFKRRRETEIKHGRVSMLATMGYITPEITGKLPGYLSPSMGLKFVDVPNGLGAISQVPAAGWAQIVAYCFYCEYSNGYGENSPVPGESGFKPPLLATDDAELKTKRLNAELANGRLAMAAIIGMFFQDGLTGSAWGDWAQYTASPLRAFEN